MLVIFTFAVFHIVFGLIFIYADGQHKPMQFNRVVGILNVAIYVPLEMFKLYLATYFYRMSLRFLQELNVTFEENFWIYEVILFIILVIQVT